MKFHVMLIGAFLRLARSGAMRQLSYEGMITGYEGNGKFFSVPVEMIDEWFVFGILRLIRSLVVGPVLVLVSVAGVAKVEGKALYNQE